MSKDSGKGGHSKGSGKSTSASRSEMYSPQVKKKKIYSSTPPIHTPKHKKIPITPIKHI